METSWGTAILNKWPLRSPWKGRKRRARGRVLVGLLLCWLVGFNTAQANTVSHHFRPHYVVKTNHVVTAICKRLGKCSFLDPRRKIKQFNKVMAFLSAGHHSGHYKLLCFPSHLIHLIHPLSMRELRHIQSQHPARSPGSLRPLYEEWRRTLYEEFLLVWSSMVGDKLSAITLS